MLHVKEPHIRGMKWPSAKDLLQVITLKMSGGSKTQYKGWIIIIKVIKSLDMKRSTLFW